MNKLIIIRLLEKEKLESMGIEERERERDDINDAPIHTSQIQSVLFKKPKGAIEKETSKI